MNRLYPAYDDKQVYPPYNDYYEDGCMCDTVVCKSCFKGQVSCPIHWGAAGLAEGCAKCLSSTQLGELLVQERRRARPYEELVAFYEKEVASLAPPRSPSDKEVS